MNLQGGDNNINIGFYKAVFKYIPDGSTILNFGCGSRFNFERELLKEKKAEITGVDLIDIQDKPGYIKEFHCRSVEEQVYFNKKFDVVTFFELIEHIDKTDELIKNCYKNLKDDGILILSFPNLASIYARIELFLGFQPHVLEVSNEVANLGTGLFGELNGGRGKTLHHIRGITHRAMKDLLDHHGFEIKKMIGYEYRLRKLLYYFPTIAPVNIFICKKKK